MYTAEIIWFITWPVLIYASYLASKWALKKFEKNIEN